VFAFSEKYDLEKFEMEESYVKPRTKCKGLELPTSTMFKKTVSMTFLIG
jgi:hypothetical protein